MTVSAVETTGLEQAWAEMQALSGWRKAKGHYAARRKAQALYWFHEEVRLQLMARLAADTGLAADLARAEEAVTLGEQSPASAAARVLARFGRSEQ